MTRHKRTTRERASDPARTPGALAQVEPCHRQTNHFLTTRNHKAPRIGYRPDIIIQRTDVAKPNYQYEKRQRELEKKKKKAEKAQRKSGGGDHAPEQDGAADSAPVTPATPSEPNAAP